MVAVAPKADLRVGSALIYGAGGFSKLLEPAVRALGCDVIGYIDRLASKLNREDVFSIAEAYEAFGDTQVFVAVFSPQPDLVLILDELAQNGFTNILTPAAAALEFSRHGISLDQYWLTASSDLIDATHSVAESVPLHFADARSTTNFRGLLEYRLSGRASLCPRPDSLRQQYVASDLNFLEQIPKGKILDCGAYTGDSVDNWDAAGLNGREILALEPDPINFLKLVDAAKHSHNQVIPIPLGVTAVSNRFEIEGSGPSTKLVPSSSGQVICVSIDDLAASLEVGLIKMDIEGGEREALKGAVETLHRSRPALAISVYHRPSDLWEIGEWLRSNFPFYRFHLRCYGHQGYDSVLYGIPEK